MTTYHTLFATAASHLHSSASEGGLTLDFDLSFIGQMVAFTLLVLVLKPLLFDPMMKLFEERERRTEGAKLAARRMDEHAGELLRRYDAELERVRRTGAEESERLRSEGQKLEAEILALARAETAKILDQGKTQIAHEASAIRGELRHRSQELARDITRAVLGREVN